MTERRQPFKNRFSQGDEQVSPDIDIAQLTEEYEALLDPVIEIGNESTIYVQEPSGWESAFMQRPEGVEATIFGKPVSTTPPNEQLPAMGYSSVDIDKDLQDRLSTLTERERIVMSARFGITDGKTKTLKEAGELIGRSARTAGRVEKSALPKLRRFRPQK